MPRRQLTGYARLAQIQQLVKLRAGSEKSRPSEITRETGLMSSPLVVPCARLFRCGKAASATGSGQGVKKMKK